MTTIVNWLYHVRYSSGVDKQMVTRFVIFGVARLTMKEERLGGP